MHVNSNLPLTQQAILFFQCKVSASRHETGQYRLKHVAFVEELWTLKPIARRQDILTSEFDVKRLYRTSPDATYYCIDVWRIIGDACSILTFETGTTLCMNFCVSWYVEPDFWCEIHNIMYETWVRWYEVRSSSMKFTLRMK
jgi:hypothetical protein